MTLVVDAFCCGVSGRSWAGGAAACCDGVDGLWLVAEASAEFALFPEPSAGIDEDGVGVGDGDGAVAAVMTSLDGG